MPNRFFIWPLSESKPRPFDPDQLLPQLPASDARYFVQIARLLPDQDATIVITWHIDAFDPVMNDAVVILVGDERYQIPSYRSRVRVIFKTGGIDLNPLRDTLALPISISWRQVVRDARNLILRQRRAIQYAIDSRPDTTPMHELPLGYFALQPIDPPPIEHREIDVFFAGGLTSAGWSARPSAEARKQMSAAMRQAQQAFPHYRIESIVKAAGSNGKLLGPMEYTQRLANSKIALAPRGNFDETFRLFEAASLGCVIIAEALPPRWYYRDCPVVELRSWSGLSPLIQSLLADRARLQELSARTRQWWDTMLSEHAIARFIASRLAPLGARFLAVARWHSLSL